MRRVPILYLGILTAVVAFSVGGSGDEATRAATTPSLMDLLCDPGARREVMNEGLIAVADKGLRIEVAPGKEWALAAATHVQLPFDAERIHLSIGQLSPGARAIIKLVGDFDGSGRAKTVLPLE
ncbi:MAG: hypothetical protein NTU83_10365, partial [Candidatus Hydrogenedentes bacterium]|nr:hypothetical protein [Candidatus Hydrogenedentota bacterium]